MIGKCFRGVLHGLPRGGFPSTQAIPSYGLFTEGNEGNEERSTT